MNATDRALALLGSRLAEAEINAAQYQALMEQAVKQLEETQQALKEANKLAGQLEAARNEAQNLRQRLAVYEPPKE